jgi:hypothetical protein
MPGGQALRILRMRKSVRIKRANLKAKEDSVIGKARLCCAHADVNGIIARYIFRVCSDNDGDDERLPVDRISRDDENWASG